MVRYGIVTLVGLHKMYSMEKFFEHIDALTIPPEEICLSTTTSIFEECKKLYKGRIPLRHIHGPEDLGDDKIESTTSAREAIRVYLLSAPYDWALWLDNDILVPPRMIEMFEEHRKLKPHCLWFYGWHPNRKFGRESDRQFSTGMGDSFVHKELMCIPFTRIKFRDSDLGDDYIWIQSVISVTRFADRELVVQGPLYNVEHFREDGFIVRFPEKELLRL